MPNEAVPASPNLDALARHRPACKRALVRLLWPKIQASLEVGHTVREILEKLKLDGIELSYPSLCRYVSELRETPPDNSRKSTAPLRRENTEPALAVAPRRDPLANVRRLTEEKPPGFHYPGTMSDKELFGE
jgi:hypothetical protein